MHTMTVSEMARLGGIARARSMTADQRLALSRRANRAKWRKRIAAKKAGGNGTVEKDLAC